MSQKLQIAAPSSPGHHSAGDDDDDHLRESCPNIGDILKQKLSNACSVQGLVKRFPILEWLPKYQTSFLLADFVAGLSVGLTAIPQAIAYAVVAGLPPQYGLYSGFMGCFVYAIFGSCKDITIGPTAIMSLMIHSAVVNLNVQFAILGTFLSGVVIFLFGIFNLGFLVQFISVPTITGFISAATITIGSGQVKPLLGIKSGSSSEFIDSWENVFSHLDEVRPGDTTLGLFSLLILMLLKRSNQIKRWPMFFKYLAISRNALIVILGIVLAYVLQVNGYEPFRLTGDVQSGLPEFSLPPFSTSFDGQDYEFRDMVRALGFSLLTIPLVSILESVAIAKAFSKGKIVDATQEMIALGLCNIFSSFAQSIPITGSFTRTAVNNASGVKTQLGGCFTGALVLLALGLLTKTFYFIPKTVLAAVIISAMISMFEIHEIIEIYRTKRSDIVPFLATFIVSLVFGLEFGIGVGVVINIFITLYQTSRPAISYTFEKTADSQEVLIVKPDQCLIYSSAEYFKAEVLQKSVVDYEHCKIVVIEGSSISFIDSTVAKIISSMIADLAVNKKRLLFWNWNRETSHVILRHNRQYFDLFKYSESLKDLFHQIRASETLSEIKTEQND